MITSRTFAGALVILVAGALAPPARADLFSLTDVNPAPNVFECMLSTRQKDVTIGGATVHGLVYRDDSAAVPPASAGIPIQVMKLKVGDLVVCHFENHFTSEMASIHWHGIELDNDSDGTAVTQDAVFPGQSYTYKFKTFRPGIFWFHSHMLPGNTLFGGTYGVIIVENDIEASLVGNVLPAAADTYTLALSDITFDAMGKVGKDFGGITKTLNELVAICHLGTIGEFGGDTAACAEAGPPGKTVLVNGQTPDSLAKLPKYVVKSGQRIRLRLLNESISRHFRLRLMNSGDNALYRIGGQGGLLDNVVVEGGMKGSWDTKYNPGELVLASGARADVLVVPSGPQGSTVVLVGNALMDPFKLSTSTYLPTANYPIAWFEISGNSTDTPPAAGDPILAGTAEDVENIKTGLAITPLIDPAPASGSSDETIRLTTAQPTGPDPFITSNPGIDEYAAMLDANAGNGDWLLIPATPKARYARVGDVLELTLKNETAAVHPFHLHGFSMQPVRVLNAAGATIYTWDYDEFLDTIDIYGGGGMSVLGQSLVVRVRLEDREAICDAAPSYPPGPVLADCEEADCGGAVGRWLFHCHILSHGALGMIGELDVLPALPKADELDGPCCTITLPNLPDFPAASSPALGACWDHCAQGPQRALEVAWDAPSQPVATEFSTQLEVTDSVSGLPMLSGPMVLDYTRTWMEVPPTGPPIQVWRFVAKADLSRVPGAPDVCPLPPCLAPGQQSSAFYYGYVDYAACAASGPWWNVLVLNHAPDRFIHAGGLSDKAGVYHPFGSYAIIAPHSPAQTFVPGSALAPGGALAAHAMRNVNVPALPTDVSLVNDQVSLSNLGVFGGGCMATLSKNPKQYTLRKFTGQSLCLNGAGAPGAWASLEVAFPALPWSNMVSTSIGHWTNPDAYPGLESAWVDEGLFVHLDVCTGDFVELKYGGSTRDGWEAILGEQMVSVFTDLASNYSDPLYGPYTTQILGSIRTTKHLISVSR